MRSERVVFGILALMILILLAIVELIITSPYPRPIITTATSTTTTTIFPDDRGTLNGSVDIGPLCPVVRVGIPCGPNDIYSSRKLFIFSNDNSTVAVVKLNSDGTFQTSLSADYYIVYLSDCQWLSCKSVLPQKITIQQGMTTYLNIKIDTGIR